MSLDEGWRIHVSYGRVLHAALYDTLSEDRTLNFARGSTLCGQHQGVTAHRQPSREVTCRGCRRVLDAAERGEVLDEKGRRRAARALTRR